ncbi:MAG: chemotaxis protein CheA [Lysobacterales bacterium RIFOXYD1_FULL_69_11]|nr:MAG: chemotaxis protein CheA [Xanthomonadales bacterium RIFOXYA1_FULL_69_10]OHE88063.1 MAG: chemotaxis protein CheA [Xanthomonadales bacterium RIFOXYD1_FULL_69_11]
MDITQFHAAFFEESREGLDAMEAGLLGLEESGRADAETVNTIFRAAHSIKGGAATFGFSVVTDLTHVLETLLDQARSGGRVLDSEATGALLASVDVLRDLLAVYEQGGPDIEGRIDHAALAQARAGLDRMLAGAAGAATTSNTAQAAADTGPDHWRIAFHPLPSLFMSGNDPLRILRELAGLGEMTVECHDRELPAFASLDPHEAHLGWSLTLPGTVKRGDIDEAFAWVEDQCELEIEAVAKVEAAPVESAANTNAPAANAPARGAVEADTSIRVAVNKVDALINLVGELVITQAMLRQRAQSLDPVANEALLSGLEQLDRNTRDLQEAVMGVRMLPVEFAFSRFPRMVRDVASRLNKKVRLKTSGEATELDKGVIEKIVDPLVHLMRNAIDHGLESPEERRAAGKDETGTISMSAAHQGGHIIIEVGDDGRGLDRERILRKAAERNLPVPDEPTDAQVWDLVFHPGFSTADALTDLSGRGVGMDVVKSNIVALGGNVEIRSARGQGSTISIRLPLTLAIMDGMSVAVGDEVFIIPLNMVVESLQPGAGDVRTVTNEGRVLRVRDEFLPLLNLAATYGLPAERRDDTSPPIAVVVECDGRKLALEVDELVGQQQVVVKNLEANYRRIDGVSGATIMGDGRVALIVDAGGLGQAARLPAAA